MRAFKTRGLRARILATVAAGALGAALMAGASPAQDEDEVQSVPSGATAAAAEADRVVVTGSRIVRQDYEANSPIVTVDQGTFENTSTIGIETILNQLPQFIPSLATQTGGSQFSSGSLEGNSFQTPGSSTVNLRGLGSNRNLVLVDGRRAMATNASMAVDTNSIPSSAVERVEIISGGASATYGADAVAGVVNFITKSDFEGLTLDTNYGVTEYGDGTELRISGLWGVNSADGRGSVQLGLEHASRGAADANARDWRRAELADPWRIGTDFWFAETYWRPEAFDANGDGVLSGAEQTNRADQNIINAIFSEAAPGSVANTNGFFVNPGSGTVFTGGRGLNTDPDGAYRYEGALDGSGVEWRGDFPYRKRNIDGTLSQNQEIANLTVPLDRYSAFARGSYDLSDSLSVISSANFARTRTSTVSQAASAITIQSATVPHGTDIYADSLMPDGVTTNPAYLPGGAYGLNDLPGDPSLGVLPVTCGPIGGCSNSYVFPMPVELRALLDSRPFPNAPAQLDRSTDFFPQRRTFNSTTNFQLMAGLEGELPNEWRWDASLSHGQSEVVTTYRGMVSLERYRAIAQSPNYGVNFFAQANQQEGGSRGGIGTCETGLPFFKDFEVSEDCLKAVEVRMKQDGQMSQQVFEANLTGDLFELPAGALQFALGATYRENEYTFLADALNSDAVFNDSIIGLAPTGDTQGAIDVYELYGEAIVPVVSDLPGIRELSLELGGRYSEYSASGGVGTYKALADWLILDWMRFRGGWNRATRAPNIAELYLGRTLQVFGSSGTQGDPCSLNNFVHPLSAAVLPRASDGLAPPASPEQAEHTRAICEALMGTGAAASYYDRAIADMSQGSGPTALGIGNVLYAGNPNVDPETADTFTAGLVLTSPFPDNAFLGDFSASVDYYRIELEDVIALESGDDVQERCFSLADNPTGSIDNPYCARMLRDSADGDAQSVDLIYTNEGRAELSGVDVQVNARWNFDDVGLSFAPGGVGVNVLATFPVQFDTWTTEEQTRPFDWVGHLGSASSCLGLSCTSYEYTVFTTLNYFAGPFSASMRWQHYPEIDSSQSVTVPTNTTRGIIKSYDVFALTGSYDLNETVRLRAGVENLFDTPPAIGGGDGGPAATPTTVAPGRQYNTGVYDPLGRRYFVGLTAEF